MAVTDAIVTALERNWDMVDRALAGMDYETMARRLVTPATPSPGFCGT